MSEKFTPISKEAYIEATGIVGDQLVDNPDKAHEMAKAEDPARFGASIYRLAAKLEGSFTNDRISPGAITHSPQYIEESVGYIRDTESAGIIHEKLDTHNPTERRRLGAALGVHNTTSKEVVNGKLGDGTTNLGNRLLEKAAELDANADRAGETAAAVYDHEQQK